MINNSYANNFLNTLFQSTDAVKNSDGVVTTPAKTKYLGFSSTEPTLKADGTIGNFTEPDGSTGYVRLALTSANSAAIDEAVDATSKNGSYNLAFAPPNKGEQYGTATHIGFFDAQTGGAPFLTAKLAEPQTLGLKTSLVLYKNDLTATLTATEAEAAE